MTRVLLDATAVPQNRGGVGRYIDELVPALVGLGTDLTVACQGRDADYYRQLAGQHSVLVAPRWAQPVVGRFVWEQVGLPWMAHRAHAEVVHSPHYTMPLLTRRRAVVTLHDATFFTDPGMHDAIKSRFFRAWTRISLRSARRTVTPSAATRTELVRVAGANSAKVDVAHLGVHANRFHPPRRAEVSEVRAALGIGETRYVAFLGTLEPRKNVPALIRAWVQTCQGRPDPPALVLAGGRGWDETIDREVTAVPPNLTLLRPGYLPLDSLAGLLGGATVVAYVSHGEGFGLPVLEAMACGAAVLTSRRLALPEIGGDAVDYCGTSDAEIAAELSALLGDPQRRAELGSAARLRAGAFTWTATARAHVASYDLAAHQVAPQPRVPLRALVTGLFR